MKKMMKLTFLTLFAFFFGVIHLSSSANISAASTPKIKKTTKKVSAKKGSKIVAKGEFNGLKMGGKSKLAKSVNAYSKKELKAFLYEWKELANVARDEDMQIYPNLYALYTDVKVQGYSNRNISLSSTTTENLGGPHPNHFRSFVTYNKKTGKKVSLKSIAKCSNKNFNQKVIKRLNQKYKSNQFFDSYKSDLKKYKFSKYNFYYKKNKLHIYFNQYEIAPYAMGPIDIVI